MHLYIVGTHHKHQFGHCSAFDPKEQACDAFAAYLKHECQSLCIQIVAEEMCSDARRKWDIQQTVPQSIACELGISHADCDPNEEERIGLGIQNEGRVRMFGQINDQAEKTVKRNIRLEYDKREQEWIRRLGQLSCQSVLFVCGTSHSTTFAEKTRQCGWNTITITEEWAEEH